MKDYDTLVESVSAIAEQMRGLQAVAMAQYTPVVEIIIATHSHDVRQIEHTLDGLLDFCAYEQALLLYRRLCRHYFDIDPAATAYYINAYRELWDSEPSIDPVSVQMIDREPEAVERIKNTPPFLELDGSDAKGLIGTDGE